MAFLVPRYVGKKLFDRQPIFDGNDTVPHDTDVPIRLGRILPMPLLEHLSIDQVLTRHNAAIAALTVQLEITWCRLRPPRTRT
jgi:hypothetical protein